MRVIAGTARGRRLAVPEGDAVRPTGDRVREALFSSITPRLRDAVVLDLFAGSGALGIEALSRGARHATFVELEPSTVKVLQANVAAAGVTDRSTVACQRALAFLRAGSGAYDLAFLDPPYGMQQAALTTVLGALGPQMASGGLVIVERDARSEAPAWPDDLRGDGERAYGSTRLHRAVRDDQSRDEVLRDERSN